LIIGAFVRVFREQWKDDAFRAIVGLAVGVLLVGTVFYVIVEGWSPLNALYFCVVTLATVGYGDLRPTTDLGKAFTIVFILTGVGIIVALASRVVDGMVSDRVERIRERGRASGASVDIGPIASTESVPDQPTTDPLDDSR
jgi:hypothetical protein